MLRCLLFLASGMLCLAAEPAAFLVAPTGNVLDIVYIGDSITAGAGLKDAAHQAPPVICSSQIEAKLQGAAVFFSNQGHSGHTTVDFLPALHSDFDGAEAAARDLQTQHPGKLVFSIMLGTNDSAVQGPRGAPVSPDQYAKNLGIIIDQLLGDFPGAQVVIHRPIWYSPNTHNRSTYDQDGLNRLNAYAPAVEALVGSENATHPGQVHLGDTLAYAYFEKNYLTEQRAEKGQEGIFYLHPNPVGAVSLGKFWAEAIVLVISPTK